MYVDSIDATREVMHDDQDPVRLQDYRLAAKEVDTPQTVLRAPEKNQLGWPIGYRLGVPPTRTIADQKLMLDEQLFGDDGSSAARLK